MLRLLPLTAVLFAVVTSAAQADTLATRDDITFTGRLNTMATSDPFSLSLYIETPPPPPPPFDYADYPPSPNPRDYFTVPGITETSVGTTYSVTSANDPNLIAALTDGNPLEYLVYSTTSQYGGGGNFGRSKTGFFTDLLVPSANGIDFSGYKITGIDITIDQVSVSSDPSNENPLGYSIVTSLSLEGVAAPEPSSWGLALVGVGAFVYLRRRSFRA